MSYHRILGLIASFTGLIWFIVVQNEMPRNGVEFRCMSMMAIIRVLVIPIGLILTGCHALGKKWQSR